MENTQTFKVLALRTREFRTTVSTSTTVGLVTNPKISIIWPWFSNQLRRGVNIQGNDASPYELSISPCFAMIQEILVKSKAVLQLIQQKA